MDTAILIPAYNPDSRLITLVQELNALSLTNIIVVDDGSDPQCSHIFETLRFDYFCHMLSHAVNLGKGAALKTGLREAIRLWPDCTGVVTADADGQHQPRDILRVCEALRERQDSLILGVRRFTGPQVPRKSRMGNKITATVFCFCTGRSCSDTQTGLRGLPASRLAEWIEVPGSRYEYEMNLLLRAAKDKTDIIEVPIKTIYLDNNNASHFHPWRDSALIYLGIARFGLSSLLSAALDLSLFALLTGIIWGESTTGILWATVSARFCSGVVNYITNRNWVFRSSGNPVCQASGYLLLFFALMFGSWKLVDWLHVAGFPTMPAKMLADSALFIASYQIQKNVIFRTGVERKRQEECL